LFYFSTIWYILRQFGIFFHVLVSCAEKNLAPLQCTYLGTTPFIVKKSIIILLHFFHCLLSCQSGLRRKKGKPHSHTVDKKLSLKNQCSGSLIHRYVFSSIKYFLNLKKIGGGANACITLFQLTDNAYY
jgi:hypothetical protein